MFAITAVIIFVILILLAGLFVIGIQMNEYEKGFTYFTWSAVVLIIAIAVYLTYAMPSVAKFEPRGSTGVTQDESNLLSDE